jgi:hypothetical protein
MPCYPLASPPGCLEHASVGVVPEVAYLRDRFV